jgi:hypothetical protein
MPSTPSEAEDRRFDRKPDDMEWLPVDHVPHAFVWATDERRPEEGLYCYHEYGDGVCGRSLYWAGHKRD